MAETLGGERVQTDDHRLSGLEKTGVDVWKAYLQFGRISVRDYAHEFRPSLLDPPDGEYAQLVHGSIDGREEGGGLETPPRLGQFFPKFCAARLDRAATLGTTSANTCDESLPLSGKFIRTSQRALDFLLENASLN